MPAPPATSMHVFMPPDTPPPDDERRPAPAEGNVVDPTVLAERRAQRAEQAEHSAARRAADAQVLAAQLARERTRLEAERDAARAEADAAREGADAAIAEAAHLKTERDELRDALGRARERLQAERPPLPEVEGEQAAASPAVPETPSSEPAGVAQPATRSANGSGTNGHAAGPPATWVQALRRELTVSRARATGRAGAPGVRATPAPAALAPVPGLARERRMVAGRPSGPGASAMRPAAVEQRRGDRAAPVTALALERERSSRLQAQLDESLAVQRELRLQLAALERAVAERVEAERRIETALRRVREELTAANALAVVGPSAVASAAESPPPSAAPAATEPPASAAQPPQPPRAPAGAAAPAGHGPTAAVPTPPESSQPHAPAPPPEDPVAPHAAVASAPPAPGAPAPEVALDPARLSAARERLRAAAPPAAPAAGPLREGPASPWLPTALQGLLASDPELAGRLAVGLLPAYRLPAERALRCDLQLAGARTVALDLQPGAATVRTAAAPRGRRETDVRIAADHAGLARLLYGRRSLRRHARVRGSRRALRELRRLARHPYGIRDLADSGVTLEPALALRLIALAIDPAATGGERFAIAHQPLAGGPVGAWLRIADGAPPAVVAAAPPEPVRLTLRCTRGAILPLIAGTEPPPGESGTLDGDDAALALLRTWIAATEQPAA